MRLIERTAMTRNHLMASAIDDTLYALRNLAEKGCRGFDCSEHSLSVLKSWAHSPYIRRSTAGMQDRQTSINVQPLPATVPASSSPQMTDSLDAIVADLADCQRCKLSTTRTRIVFGVGSPTASLIFVGEAPGFDEDQQGLPFVGKAGQLLTKIIQAINLTRDQVYICNVIKCRPPGNRNPEPDEIVACVPFLNRQIASIQPEFICALGTFAAQTLLKTTLPISKLRGRFHDYNGIRLLPTFHPSYLLRSPDKKREVWEDMKLLMNEMSP